MVVFGQKGVVVGVAAVVFDAGIGHHSSTSGVAFHRLTPLVFVIYLVMLLLYEHSVIAVSFRPISLREPLCQA